METWKPIAKFKGEYEVSDKGRIRSTDKTIIRSNGWKYKRVAKVLKPDINHSGYAKGSVCVDKKMIPYILHRLVAIEFIPNPENKPTVNHINGIKHDNRVENLEWSTNLEQIDHATKLGLMNYLKGSEIGNSKLKESDVIEIRRKFKPRKYTRAMLAKEYGVAETTIKDIILKRSWKHLL